MEVSEYIEKNYEKILSKSVMCLRCTQEEAEDMLQTTWIKARVAKPNVAPAKIGAYVNSMMFNLFKRNFKKWENKARADVSVTVTTTETPESQLINRQFQDAVSVIAEKPTVGAKVFKLMFVENMDSSQISKKLNMNVETVRSHIKIGKKLGRFVNLVQDHAYIIPRQEVRGAGADDND